MDKKLERLLKPGKGIYFFILFCFCALSFLTGYVWLGVGELAVALLTLAFYLVERRARKRNIYSPIRIPWRASAREKVRCLR